MTGSSLHQYFYLPYESRPEIEFPDLALAKGGSPPWKYIPSYPSPPMSSPPSPQRKVSDIQPPPATTFSELTLSGTTTSTNPSSTSSVFTIPPVSTGLPTSVLRATPQSFAPTPTADPSRTLRTYSSSSGESILYRTESASSASNVPEQLATAGPSAGPGSPTLGRGGRRTKAHVANACNNCKRAHLSCDVERPCGRCVATGKAETCRDVPHKKRGRPRLRDEGQFHVQQGGAGADTAQSPEMGPSTVRPIAGPRHRRTGSLRTLRASAGDIHPPQSATTFIASATVPGHVHSLGSAAVISTPGLAPPPRQPRLAPSPEVPIAFLDTDFVILKANTTFQRLFSWLQEIRGIRLSDIAKPLEGDSFQNARNRLREEREIREPAYLPPILQPRLDPVAGLGITDHDVDEVTRGFADHSFAWTFRLGGGIDQTLPVRMRLAKSSVYFVTLFLPPLPPQAVELASIPQPGPPSVMFPTRGVPPPAAPFHGSPRMLEQQPGISEPSPTFYTFPTAGATPPNISTARIYAPEQHQQVYAQLPHYQSQYIVQQPQQMLPPPPSIPSASERPGTAGSGSSVVTAQPSFLPPPHARPRSDTIESLGRHVQTRLRADSGATMPVFQSSPVQQRPGGERHSSSESFEEGGGGSPRKRRRLDINEVLQR